MYFRRHEPVLLTEDGLEGLCASLNRPVVHVDGLPVAPARAVIALHRDLQGQRSVVIGVRSEEPGVAVLYAYRGEPDATDRQAMDDGLAFAEGMGFLFDEDQLQSQGPGARARAFQHWCEIAGHDLHAGGPHPASPAGDSSEMDDLLAGAPAIDQLDDLVEAVPEGGVLSKFRREAAPAEPAVAGAAPGIPEPLTAEASTEPAVDYASDSEDGVPARLGRIPIVRKKNPQAEVPESPLLTRLLARF
jgi:hypothetical protein